MQARRRIRREQDVSPAPFAGMIGMAAALFLYAFAGLVAPWWVVPPLLVLWLVLFVLCVRWWTPYPRRLPVVAGVAVACWLVVVLATGTATA